MQPHSCRVSKFLNDGTEVKVFGEKGRGPGEFEWGMFWSYSEDSHIIGIYDILNYKISYFDESCKFRSFESTPLMGISHFKYIKNSAEIFSYSLFPDNNGFWKNVITVNDSIILSNNEKTNSQIPEQYYRYSYNSDRIIIMEEPMEQISSYIITI